MENSNVTLERKLDILLERMEQMERKLDTLEQQMKGEILDNCRKMGEHISFVDSVYSMVKQPMVSICNTFYSSFSFRELPSKPMYDNDTQTNDKLSILDVKNDGSGEGTIDFET